MASTTATAFTYTPRPAGLLATLSPAGPLEACAPRTLTATAASPAFATGAGLGATVSAIVARPNGKLLLGGAFMSLSPGGSDKMLGDGGTVTITQSATNLEDLLGKFIFNVGSLADATQKSLDRQAAPPGPPPQ